MLEVEGVEKGKTLSCIHDQKERSKENLWKTLWKNDAFPVEIIP